MREILALFDEAIAWLSGKGLSKQWGARPFSENRQMLDRIGSWIDSSSMYGAQGEGVVLGAIVLSDEPPDYVSEVSNNNSPNALYLEAFVTKRRFAGYGVGLELLSWAERVATEWNFNWLQLDCWSENESLCQYYRRAGFYEIEEFDVGDWRGVLFEKPALAD